MSKFLDYLLNVKGIPYAKGQTIVNKINRLDAVEPDKANMVLEDNLRYSDCLELLKQYILSEESAAAPKKSRITKDDFERHFHIIQANGRGRKPKGDETKVVGSAIPMFIDNGED